jgi:hypothetical protein
MMEWAVIVLVVALAAFQLLRRARGRTVGCGPACGCAAPSAAGVCAVPDLGVEAQRADGGGD